MMNHSQIEQQLADRQWTDVELRGLEWVDDGRGLALKLRLPPNELDTERDRVLHADWVTELATTFSYPRKTGGYPLTWDVAFERDTTGEWLVRFDFGSVGKLDFRCVDLALRPMGHYPVDARNSTH
jgi:hypothetical protein